MAKPTISTVSPPSGPTAGGTPVTVSGTNFGTITHAFFGGVEVSFTQTGANQPVSVTSPAHVAGAVDIRLQNATGLSDPSAMDRFTYRNPEITSVTTALPPTNKISCSNSTSITVSGSFFHQARRVWIDGVEGTNFTLVSTAQITVTAPPHAPGCVDVEVENDHGRSDKSPAAMICYALPDVSNVMPLQGAAGTPVTINGFFLSNATLVSFEGVPATITSNTATQIQVTSPAVTGTANVTVSNAHGTSTPNVGDQFLGT